MAASPASLSHGTHSHSFFRTSWTRCAHCLVHEANWHKNFKVNSSFCETSTISSHHFWAISIKFLSARLSSSSLSVLWATIIWIVYWNLNINAKILSFNKKALPHWYAMSVTRELNSTLVLWSNCFKSLSRKTSFWIAVVVASVEGK